MDCRCAASTTAIAKQAGLGEFFNHSEAALPETFSQRGLTELHAFAVEDLVSTLVDLERRVKACSRTMQELQVEALPIKALASKR